MKHKTFDNNQTISVLIDTQMKLLKGYNEPGEHQIINHFTDAALDNLIRMHQLQPEEQLTGKYAETRDKIVQLLEECFKEEAVDVPADTPTAVVLTLAPEAVEQVPESPAVPEAKPLQSSADLFPGADLIERENTAVAPVQTVGFVANPSDDILEFKPGELAQIHGGIPRPKLNEHDDSYRA